MSKLSDDLQEVMESTREMGTAIKIAGSIAQGNNEVPGFRVWSDLTKRRVSALLRSAKFHYAGAEPWESGELAIEETAKFMNEEVVETQLRSLAQGIKIGLVPEWETSEDFKKLFNDDLNFRLACTIQMLDFRLDKDVMSVVSEQLAASVVNVSEIMRFRSATGKETNHVWDVWYAALGSNTLGMYVSGIRLGRLWREREILAGIMEATSEVSNDRVADD